MIFTSPISVLIIGIGVWEAWRLNRARTVHITGPFALVTQSTPSNG
jgi:hypothetical protein